MKQVVEVFGKTVESAIADGAAQLGVDRENVTYEILEMPKKGFLGFGEIPAKVRVTYDSGSENAALDFVRLLISDMEIDAKADIFDMPEGGGKLIRISGPDASILIGHHGATLDALQYLVNLAANKKAEEIEQSISTEESEVEEESAEEDFGTGLKTQMTERSRKVAKGYMRITVDIENYRAKREETLRALARRMAGKVQKYKKSITLEPMNPYERRIIHSEIQNISGITTTSIGSDGDRKIVIYSENGEKPMRRNDRRGRYNRGQGGNRRARESAPEAVSNEASAEAVGEGE